MAKQTEKMVQPKVAEVVVQAESTPTEQQTDEKPNRLGLVCDSCKSTDVEVRSTIDLSKKYPGFMSAGAGRRIRRYLRCKKCQRRWSAEFTQTETKREPQKR